MTLIYLALQVRQANILAKADSLQKSFANYSSWRQMLTDDEINSLWLQSLEGETLSPQEEQRVYVVLSELAMAAVAATANNQATGNQKVAETSALVVVRELRSQTMRKVWARVADDLVTFGFADFASAVADLLGSEGARS